MRAGCHHWSSVQLTPLAAFPCRTPVARSPASPDPFPKGTALALKPRDPNDDRAFVREVDEEVRREALTETVRRYGLAIALGVVAILVAVGGVLWWQHERAAGREELAERYVTTLNDLEARRSVDVAERMAPLLESSDPGYAATARLLLAGQAIKRNDFKAAVGAYGAVAGDEGVPEPFRRIALIRQTALEYEALSPAEIERRLAPLARPGQPYFGSAGELLAHARIKAGNAQAAGALLAQIAADSSVPPTIRSRATQLAGSMGVDAVQPDPADAASPTATGPTR